MRNHTIREYKLSGRYSVTFEVHDTRAGIVHVHCRWTPDMPSSSGKLTAEERQAYREALAEVTSQVACG